MKKTIFKKYESLGYWFFISHSFKAQIVGNFLTDSYSDNFVRAWLVNDMWTKGGSEMVDLEKKDDSIIFSDAYDDSDDKLKFTVSSAIFLKILNEWKCAREEDKEYIVIEVSDDDDVHIYGTDHVEISEEEQSEQKRLREEMYKKINSQEPFKSFSKKKKNIQ